MSSTAIPSNVQARYVAEGLWNDAGLRDGVEHWAAHTPDRIALVDADGELTYRELEHSVACAVGTLRGRGVRPGDRAVIVAPISIPAVVAYLAVIRTSAVAVLLDRRSGKADLQAALALPGVRLMIASSESAETLGLAGSGLEVVDYDGDFPDSDADRSWTEPDPAAVAAIVFTSGTTSRPKGVVHSLNTLRSGARGMADAFEVTSVDNAFLAAPLASITGLVQTHLMLDRGAGLILENRFDPAHSLARLRAHGATVIGGAPIIVTELFKQAAASGVDSLPLRAMALGGTMIPRPLLDLAVEKYGITPVRMYGASEIPCATGSRPTDQDDVRLSDDGAPSRGTELRNDGDVDGEILVRGPMRCLGYVDADDELAAFTSDGWYRSGDLGRFDDGRLTVTGRLKEVVARKGIKISLAEVDAAAATLTGIEEAASYAVVDPDTGERVALAIRYGGDDSSARTFESIAAALLDFGLAKGKLPEEIAIWDEPLPRTETGKLQRRLIADDEMPRPRLLAERLRNPK